MTGAIIEKLNQEQLRNISIPIPTIEEQKRIISLIDKAINKSLLLQIEYFKLLTKIKRLFYNFIVR
ncbi:restriction endonuclease subunit S [bacterium]|nr:restriction endonuclease subunit S [bacterium]